MLRVLVLDTSVSSPAHCLPTHVYTLHPPLAAVAMLRPVNPVPTMPSPTCVKPPSPPARHLVGQLHI